MLKTNSLIILIFIVLAIKINAQVIPVSESNPFSCSSFLKPSNVADYKPGNICDFDQSTAWVEGVEGDGIGEWVAIYLGRLEELKDISELDIKVYAGYQKKIDSFENNGVPVGLKFELFLDDQIVSAGRMYEPLDEWELRGERNISLITNVNLDLKGSIWLKVTILKVKKGKRWDDTAISEIVCNFKNANPNDLKEGLKKFKEGIVQQKSILIREFTNINADQILSSFTNEFDPEAVPMCCAKPIIHSESRFYLHATEGGDGSDYAMFELENRKWKLKKFSYFGWL